MEKEPNKPVTFFMPKTLVKEFTLYCVKHDTNKSEMIRELIKRELKKEEGK